MANIKGITIEIGGNTTKLENALSNVNKAVYSANNELKDLNKALKLDPKNTELLAQKQDVLKKNISATTEKLNTLKEAQKQMGNYSKLTDAQKESYRALSVEITKSENSLKNLNNELKSTNGVKFDALKKGLSSVGDVAGELVKKVTAISAAIGGALAGVVGAGVKSYASLEQNVGGVETLFGKDAEKVMQNASKAFETAGVSANEYMAGVTSFSASLLQSLGNDTSKAADVADMAFKDMSDNANKFGTDMSSIQSAYQGFAKQNYTMLDNLKLGYGGTKTEMERLLKDAQKISGVKYDISNLNDVYSAIHVIQEEMGVTGTTAKEASTTIQGSVTSMKASFDNFINGSGSPEQLAESIENVLNNISKSIKDLAPKILSGITTLVRNLLPKITKILFDLIPQLLQAVTQLINSLLDMIASNTEKLKQTIISFINTFVNFITENLPTIIEMGILILTTLALGIADSIPDIIPVIIQCIFTIIDTFTNNIDLMVETGFKLLVAIATGIVKAVPQLLGKIPDIIAGIVKGFTSLMSQFWDLGGAILDGILKGLTNIGSKIKNAVKTVGTKIKDGFKSFFGIHSPSRLMSDEVGLYIGEGVTEGIIDGLDETEKKVNNAMRDLSNGIEASVNPTINPTANTNPLIIQIENFNNNSESDIQEIAQKLEFYRRNSALARGDN